MGTVLLRDTARPQVRAAAQRIFSHLTAGSPVETALWAEGLTLVLGTRAELCSGSGAAADPALKPRLRKPDAPPFFIDLSAKQLRWRIEHPGAEALAKACLHHLPESPLVWDASAGLGRDALLLAARGAQVVMHERHPAVYLMLLDALLRVQEAQIYSFPLPRLIYGTVLECAGQTDQRPQVIYYDPMFPQRRKSALVKKEMQVFHQLVGKDEDVLETVAGLSRICTRRLVIKRPVDAAPLCTDKLQPAYQIDGGGCRFDCCLPARA